MKKAICSLTVMFMLLAAFGVGFDGVAAATSTVTLNVYNWGEYIDEDVLDMFEEETGIKINYTTFDSNETMYAKIVSGAASYDVIIPSDYMISKLADEGLLAELNFDNIPNYSLIDDAYKGLEYDPDELYSVPYMWGTVVIMYNTQYVDEEDVADQSVDLLWNEKYAGKILMFDNPRDAFALAFEKLGYSLNTTETSEWEEAAELLKEQKSLVQAYVMDQIFDKMESGEAWIAPYYAGDALIISEENPDVAYYIPTEGTNYFVDAMCVLESSEHKEEAEMFINFMCRTDIAYLNCDYVGYGTPQTEVYAMLDEELTSNEVFYPSAEFIAEHTEVFINLPTSINILQSSLWTSLKIDGESSSTSGIDTAAIVIAAILAAIILWRAGVGLYRRRYYSRKQ